MLPIFSMQGHCGMEGQNCAWVSAGSRTRKWCILDALSVGANLYLEIQSFKPRAGSEPPAPEGQSLKKGDIQCDFMYR